MRSAEKMLFHTRQQEIIDSSLFAYVRHPLYTGVLLIYLGFVLGSFSIFSFITYVFVFCTYDYLAKFEEKDLERVFGEAYVEYKKRMPRWIPRFSHH